MQAAGTDTRLVQRVYLSWRTGDGATRRIVGEFWRVDDRIDFKYLLDRKDIFAAIGEGFIGYPDIPFSDPDYAAAVPDYGERRAIAKIAS